MTVQVAYDIADKVTYYSYLTVLFLEMNHVFITLCE